MLKWEITIVKNRKCAIFTKKINIYILYKQWHAENRANGVATLGHRLSTHIKHGRLINRCGLKDDGGEGIHTKELTLSITKYLHVTVYKTCKGVACREKKIFYVCCDQL